MAIDVDAINKQIPRIESNDEVSFLSRPERISMVHEQHGFYPHSNEEASRVVALIGHTDDTLPTLQYLDMISQHQYKYHADAAGSVRAIVHAFAEYAGNAMNEAYYMEQFIDDLSVSKPNNFSSFTNLFPVHEWKYDYNKIAAFTAMARHLEIDHFVSTGVDNPLGRQNAIDLTEGKDRVDRISKSLGNLRAISLEKTAQAVHKAQNRRFDYWLSLIHI